MGVSLFGRVVGSLDSDSLEEALRSTEEILCSAGTDPGREESAQLGLVSLRGEMMVVLKM